MRKTKSFINRNSVLVPPNVTVLPLSIKHQADTVRLLDAGDDDAIVLTDDDIEDHDDNDGDSAEFQQRDRLISSKRESSHEYD